MEKNEKKTFERGLTSEVSILHEGNQEKNMFIKEIRSKRTVIEYCNRFSENHMNTLTKGLSVRSSSYIVYIAFTD